MSSRKAMRTQEICRAACKLFKERDVSSVTLSDIGEQVGLTKASLYYYFDTKDDLLRTIFAGWAIACRTPLEEIAASRADPKEKLRRIMLEHLKQITTEYDLFVIAVRDEAQFPDAVRQEFRHLKHDTDLIIRKVIQQGQEIGVFKPLDARLAELAFIGMFNWMSKWYRPDRDNADEIAEVFGRIYFAGLSDASASKATAEHSTVADLTVQHHLQQIKYHTAALQKIVGDRQKLARKAD